MMGGGNSYDAGCLRRGGSCAFGGGVCGKEARATPPSPSTAPMCERKTAKLEEEGYAKTGYVLRQPGKDREVVVSDGGAVSWFTAEQWNWLMFNRDHVEFQWPKPVGALASRPAEVDDEGLPKLPEPGINAASHIHTRIFGYTAEQYRQGQRDAVAADQARRESTADDGRKWFMVGGRRVGRTFLAALVRDAERYRWIRDAQWFKAGLAKTEVQASAFHYSGDLLDKLVDAGLTAGQRQEGDA